MKNTKVKSCETCPFLNTDEHWNHRCRIDDKLEIFTDEIQDVNEKCPLKTEGVQVTLYVEKPKVFLFHAKKPNFGFGEHIKFNKENYEMVAEAFISESEELSNVDMILEWMFVRTNSIDSPWYKKKYKKFTNRINPLKEECRSTSVGDVVVIKGNDKTTYWRCGHVGWEEVDETEYSCSGCYHPIFPFDDCDCE